MASSTVLLVVLAYGALDALIQRFVVYDSFVRARAARGRARHAARARRDRERGAAPRAARLRLGALRRGRQLRRGRGSRSGARQPRRAHARARKLDLLVLCQPSGKVLWSRALKGCEDPGAHADRVPRLPQREPGARAPAAAAARSRRSRPWPPAACSKNRARAPAGVRALDVGPEAGAQAAGLVVIGRLLTPAWQEALARQTGVVFTLSPVLEALNRARPSNTYPLVVITSTGSVAYC